MDKPRFMSVGIIMTPILTVDLKGANNQRAACALRKLEGDKQLNLNYIVIRDMVEKDHSPFVYFSDGKRTLSHSKEGNLITIYEEEYELQEGC